MVSVRVRVQKPHRQICMRGYQASHIKPGYAGIDKQRLFSSGKQKNPDTQVSFCPCAWE
jgi:hypothetical protein